MVSILLGMFGTLDKSPQDTEVGLSTGCPQGKKPIGAHLPIILCRDMLRKKDFWLV
jgi:hypothetical protein